MGLFSGIENAESYKSGRFIEPGKYTLKVSAITLVDSKKERGRKFFVVECEVVKTNNAEYREGDNVTWMVDVTPKLVDGKQEISPTAAANCSQFACAVLDCTPREINEEVMDKLMGPEQPAAGVLVNADAFTIQTKAGNDFTKIQWSALPTAAN
jgi:hypothetical protein